MTDLTLRNTVHTHIVQNWQMEALDIFFKILNDIVTGTKAVWVWTRYFGRAMKFANSGCW